jgi:hypothetical protein
VTGRIRAFLTFWYDFVIGDDWRIAAAVVAALALTYGLSTTSIPTWWVLPLAILILLPISLWRRNPPAPPTGPDSAQRPASGTTCR